MKIHVLAGFLLVLGNNGFAIPVSSIQKRLQTMITEEDIKLFNSDEGLWFLNDEGQHVQATLDMPSTFDVADVSMEDHVFFHLFTREAHEFIRLNDVESLKRSFFDPNRETKFVTHGWINSKESKACTLVKDAYLNHADYNVIVVDWSRITLRPYGWAATHVLEVGKHVAEMINFLEENGIDLNTTTLSGHSLGAHVMGLAAFYAKSTVNYVVGLDPALPLFAGAKPGHRISTEDARHVEIIHTNAGLLGYQTPIGKADFYPNGGSKQLGCLVDVGGACSHARSYEYFAESIITYAGFYGQKCKDYSSYTHGTCKGDVGMMGGPKPYLPYTGTYYLHTKGSNPFAKGKGNQD